MHTHTYIFCIRKSMSFSHRHHAAQKSTLNLATVLLMPFSTSTSYTDPESTTSFSPLSCKLLADKYFVSSTL